MFPSNCPFQFDAAASHARQGHQCFPATVPSISMLQPHMLGKATNVSQQLSLPVRCCSLTCSARPPTFPSNCPFQFDAAASHARARPPMFPSNWPFQFDAAASYTRARPPMFPSNCPFQFDVAASHAQQGHHCFPATVPSSSMLQPHMLG